MLEYSLGYLLAGNAKKTNGKKDYVSVKSIKVSQDQFCISNLFSRQTLRGSISSTNKPVKEKQAKDLKGNDTSRFIRSRK